MILSVAPLLSNEECALLRSVFDRHRSESTEVDFSGQPVLRLRQFAADCPELIRKCHAAAGRQAFEQGRPHGRFVETTILTCMSEGGWHAEHADNCMNNEAGEWVPNHTPNRTHTAIVYLSDDFYGGELRFPSRGVLVAPQSGDLVVFPAGPDYVHSVSKVTWGERYSLVMWLTDKHELEETIENE